MKPREIFLSACSKISCPFLERGFKATKSGQCLKKISKDKDLTFEIYFNSSVYNDSCSIAIYPLISVYSKSLKKWMREQTGNAYEVGSVYHNHIGYISPIKAYKVWNLAGLSFDVSVESIIRLLEQYAIPIFDRFEDKAAVIDFMERQGCCFNPYTENSLSALPYVLLHGGKEKAENYFNAYLQSCRYRNRFATAFSRWERGEEAEVGADNLMAVFAFKNGLRIR